MLFACCKAVEIKMRRKPLLSNVQRAQIATLNKER